jgi:hypothetical protein
VLASSALLSGTGTLGAAGVFAASAALSGSGTLNATGAVHGIHSASSALSGSGTLVAAGFLTLPGAAALSGTGQLAGSWVLAGGAALTGTGTLAAAGVLAGQAALSGTGILSASGVLASGAGLAGTGTLAGAGHVIWRSLSGLSGAGTLSGTAIHLTPTIDTSQWEAGPAPSRWLAGPLPAWRAEPAGPQWKATPADQWAARPAPERWRLIVANFDPIAAVSQEQVNITWSTELAGTVIDPTGQTAGQPALTVQTAFPVSSGNADSPATPVTWYPASWLLGAARGFVAQCPVGPSTTGPTLVSGQKYDVWGEVQIGGSVVKKFAGTLAVY